MKYVRKVLLWSSLVLSTILSAGFFFSLGDGLVSGFFLATLGVIFEGIKAYSWQLTGAGRWRYLVLAIPCTLLSLAASVGYASMTLERGWAGAESRSVAQRSAARDTEFLSKEEMALIASLERLPVGWTTSALKLSERLESVRAQKRSEPQVGFAPTEVTTASVAMSIGHRLGIDGALVVTALLMAIATLLELGIIMLVLDQDRRSNPKIPLETESSVQRFLREAVDPNGKLLGRRRLVELGWSEREVRDHVTTLIRSGVLIHSDRGSPIRFNSGKTF